MSGLIPSFPLLLGFLMILFPWSTSFPVALSAPVSQGVLQIFSMPTSNSMIRLMVPVTCAAR